MYVLLYCGVCTGVRLLPPGENPIAVRNNNIYNTLSSNILYYHIIIIIIIIIIIKIWLRISKLQS
jgi:hypothetical protein